MSLGLWRLLLPCGNCSYFYIYLYQTSLQIQDTKDKTTIKMGKRENRHFTEEEAQMTIRCKKRCSTSLIIGKIEIKNNEMPCTPPACKTLHVAASGTLLCHWWARNTYDHFGKHSDTDEWSFRNKHPIDSLPLWTLQKLWHWESQTSFQSL